MSKLLLPHYKIILQYNFPVLRATDLYFAIILFSFLIVVLLFCIVIIILRKSKIKIKKNRIASQLEEWLMDVVLENSPDTDHIFSIPSPIMILLRGRLAAKVLLSELMALKKSLNGVAGDNLEKIYNQLGLQEISRKRLANKHWHIKARGIQELGIMNQQACHEMIFELTHDKHHTVRMEAQLSMVRLQGYTGLQFFDSLSYPLSEWHQLSLLYLLANQTITGETGIFNWLQSSNDSVVQFSLKLIGEQHAIEFHDEVVKCLSHPGTIVRREAIICLGKIPSNDSAMELEKHFAIEPDKNLRLCIIGVLRETGIGEDLSFLRNLQQTGDMDIKLEANKTVLHLQKI